MNYSPLNQPQPSQMSSGVTAGDWIIDPSASTIGFEATAMFGMKVWGVFQRYESVISVGSSADRSSVWLSLRADTVATGIKTRDRHLRASNVFDAANFPTIEFTSQSLTEIATGLRIEGLLRVRDYVRPVTLEAVEAPGTLGAPRFKGTTVLSPAEFGITRMGIRKPVTIVFDVQLQPV